MGSLTGKKIVLGVTGGIAAYKAVEIASRLRKAGAEVHVIMTREATEFVTELTFRTPDPFYDSVVSHLKTGKTFYPLRHFSEPPYPGVPVSGLIDGVSVPDHWGRQIPVPSSVWNSQWAGYMARLIGRTEGVSTVSAVLWSSGTKTDLAARTKPDPRAVWFGQMSPRRMRPDEFDADRLDAEEGTSSPFFSGKFPVRIWRNQPYDLIYTRTPEEEENAFDMACWAQKHPGILHEGPVEDTVPDPWEVDESSNPWKTEKKPVTQAKETRAAKPARPAAPEPGRTPAYVPPVRKEPDVYPKIEIREMSVFGLAIKCAAILVLIGVLCVGASAAANWIWNAKTKDQTESVEAPSDGFDSMPSDAMAPVSFVPTVSNMTSLLNKDPEDAAYIANLGAASNVMFDWTCQAYGQEGVLQIKEDTRIHTITEVRWWVSIEGDPQPFLNELTADTGKPYLETDEYGKRTWDFATEDYTCLLVQGRDGTGYCLDVKRK